MPPSFRDVYHTLIPVESEDNRLLGIVDVGFPKSVVDKKVMDGCALCREYVFYPFCSRLPGLLVFCQKSGGAACERLDPGNIRFCQRGSDPGN